MPQRAKHSTVPYALDMEVQGRCLRATSKSQGKLPAHSCVCTKQALRGQRLPLPGLGLSLKWAASNQGTRDDLVIYLLPKGSFILDEDVLWEAT